MHPHAKSQTGHRADCLESHVHRLQETRSLSLDLAAPLSDEDMVVQAMDDASPTKWHLAHTTWFFEAFVLQAHLPDYKIFSDDFLYCFNSYYETKGARHPRAARGLLTRPSAKQVFAYRRYVDEQLDALFALDWDDDTRQTITQLIETGINHEQQHQELMMMDILALFARQPLKPAYKPNIELATDERRERDDDAANANSDGSQSAWTLHRGGVCPIGHDGKGFAYDNEGPRHHVLVHPHKLARNLVTNGEWLAFMEDGGYEDPLLWLAEGWDTVQKRGWRAPEYWSRRDDDTWHFMTLRGEREIALEAPVCHVSYYEADAFARWAGKRLPTEFEWETARADAKVPSEAANTLGRGILQPEPISANSDNAAVPNQMFGDVWEWTASPYQSYPGYKPPEGALGEYNGKFMCSQFVLRGGSCVTPDGHVRNTYRNFFYPFQRWQFSGLRLADDA